MSGYGKTNLLAMFGMPAAAAVAAAITPALDLPGAATLVTIFLLNFAVMLVAGAGAGLLLRGARKAGSTGLGLALVPSLVPAVVGSAWYLYRSLAPARVAPGSEILAGPQYLLILTAGLWILTWIAGRVGRSLAKSRAGRSSGSSVPSAHQPP